MWSCLSCRRRSMYRIERIWCTRRWDTTKSWTCEFIPMSIEYVVIQFVFSNIPHLLFFSNEKKRNWTKPVVIPNNVNTTCTIHFVTVVGGANVLEVSYQWVIRYVQEMQDMLAINALSTHNVNRFLEHFVEEMVSARRKTHNSCIRILSRKRH